MNHEIIIFTPIYVILVGYIFFTFLKKRKRSAKSIYKLINEQNWDKKKLMLPYSLRKDYISFTDKKWDWRYQFNKDGSPNINNPSLYELLPSGEIKKHFCETENNSSNL